jgi:hypothetical protein
VPCSGRAAEKWIRVRTPEARTEFSRGLNLLLIRVLSRALNWDFSLLLRPVFRFGFGAVVNWLLKSEVRLRLRPRLKTEFKPVLKPRLSREVRWILKSRLKSGLSSEFTPGVTRPFPV